MRVIKDGEGTVLQRFDYYPFGSESRVWTAGTNTPQSALRYRFGGKEIAGQKVSVSTGIAAAAAGSPYLDFGARVYDPRTAAWLSQDPLSEKYYSISPYAYCAGNPIILVDVDGKEPIKKAAGTVSGFIHFMNSIPTGIGLSSGAEAHSAMLRMGAVKGIKPANTAPFNESGNNRYIYTKKGGWIDMAHFMFYAGRAYRHKLDKKLAQDFILTKEFSTMRPEMQSQWLRRAFLDPIGETILEGFLQERIDMITAPHSAYSYEDLPSDMFGADFGANYFDPWSSLSFSDQIQYYLDNILIGTTPEESPNFNSLPEEYPDKPSQTNKTTTPMFLFKIHN